MDLATNEPCDIEGQAMRWLVRLDAGSTPEVVAGHRQWMAQSTRHQVAYAKQALAWKRMDALRRLRPLDGGGADPDLLAKKGNWFGVKWVFRLFSKRSRRSKGGLMNISDGARWLPRVLAGVAVALFAAVATVVIGGGEGLVPYSTQVGGLRRVTLDDGSTVDLNTNSQIRVRFTATRREIFLDRGEALFTVSHDASRPFEVIAGSTISRAVGTKFLVRLYDDLRVETLVTEGRVLVLRQGRLLGVSTSARPIGRTLEAGERILVGKRTSSSSRVAGQEIDRLLRWTTGKVTFEGQALGDVVRELNRYTVRPLVIKDRKIARTAVGGGFEIENAEDYAADLVRFFGEKALAPAEVGPVRR